MAKKYQLKEMESGELLHPMTADECVISGESTLPEVYAKKTYVDTAVSNIDRALYKLVDVLPTTGDTAKIYLVPAENTEDKNVYDEYIWKGDAWEKLGSKFEIDLSEIEGDIDSLEKKVTANEGKISSLEGEVATAKTTYYTKEDATKLTTRVSTNEESIGALQSTLATATATIEQLQGEIASLKTELAKKADKTIADRNVIYGTEVK